ncbi:hypothetical protein GCM10019016_036500 [Streptomyces prasinosporus]|uniref:MarR family transcriptional regulator n=1 Tax=Streptomyces prasinosporus TaxID=68256 RepID=A0ABP6TPT7_9ACTN
MALLAESTRLRVFSAVVLGASSPAAAAEAAGLSVKETAVALRRLRSGGLVTGTDGRLAAHTGHFKDIVRDHRTTEEPERHGYADERVESLLRTDIQPAL